MANTNYSHRIHLKTARPGAFGTDGNFKKGVEAVKALKGLVEGVISGANKGDCVEILPNQTSATHAFALVNMASSAGTVGATIDATAVTVTWATSDANSSTLLAAAVNASSSMKGKVLANNKTATLACSTVVAGNTVELLGYKLTGVAGTAVAADGKFSVDTGDTETATSLAAAINGLEGLRDLVRAQSVTSTVYVSLVPVVGQDTRNQTPYNLPIFASSTITVTNATFAASANTMIWAVVPGVIGNCVTIAASGTNVTILGSRTRLAAGVGCDDDDPDNYIYWVR